jgi:hypothetical protein
MRPSVDQSFIASEELGMSTIGSTGTVGSTGSSSIDLRQLMNMMSSKSHGHHHGHKTSGAQQTSSTDSTTGTDLSSQIQAAVLSTIQNFDSSSGSASDLMTAIQNTVNSTLKANGITAPSLGQPPATASGNSLATATGSQLDALLQQNGISTQQFKDGLLEMLQGNQDASSVAATSGASAQNGSTGFDLSSILAMIFKSVPTGSGVNVQA